MRSVAEAIGRAESEEIAVAGGLAALRMKLGWSEDSEWRSAVLSRFAPVAQAVSKSFRDAEAEPAPDVGGELAGFETWYAETNARSFWALFEQHMTETPRCRFLIRAREPTDFDDWIAAEFAERGAFTVLVILVEIGETKVTPLCSTYFSVIGDEVDWSGDRHPLRRLGRGLGRRIILPGHDVGRRPARQSHGAAEAASARGAARRRPPRPQRRSLLRQMGEADEGGGDPAPVSQRLLIVLVNTDPRNGEELGAPFYHAAVAAAMDYEVDVVCTATAGKLMTKGVAEQLTVKEGNAMTVYDWIKEAHSHGARFWACPANLELLTRRRATSSPNARASWAPPP